MRRVVVDAAVAVKWVVAEAYSDQATLLLEYDGRHAPDHWLAEAAHVLWAKVPWGDLTVSEADERLCVLLRAPVIGAPVAGLMRRALAISIAAGVTVYDSLYLALAERLDVPFVTADAWLIRRLDAVPGLSGRLVWVGDLPGV